MLRTSGWFLAAVLLSGAVSPCLGDPDIRRMKRHLDLKPEQKEKIQGILKEYQPRMRDLHDRLRALMKEKQGIMQERREKIRSVLTDEQRRRFDEMKDRRRPRGEPSHPQKDLHPKERGGPADHDEDETEDSSEPWWHKEDGDEPGRRMRKDLPPPEMWQEPKERP
ncbi:MAG: hypothetical protein HY551_05150 [Elusimicrobia bacterium]|nr:hypothetical protein [Elusimicrobiota bacterium]